MEAKHTPGPWKAVIDRGEVRVVVDTSLRAGLECRTEIMSEIGGNSDQVIANALLAAASPKLLDALLGFMELDSTFSTASDEHLREMARDGKESSPIAAAVLFARAAIASATGA